MEKSSISYNLSNKLTYSRKGDFEETATIELQAPSFNTMRESLKLSQLFMQAAISASKSQIQAPQETEAKDTELDGKAVNMMFLASDVDMMDVIDNFIVMACKVGTLDDEKTIYLKKDHFAKMAIKDITGMACEYIANFATPSV